MGAKSSVEEEEQKLGSGKGEVGPGQNFAGTSKKVSDSH